MKAKRNVQGFKIGVLFVAMVVLIGLVGLASSAGASDDPTVLLEGTGLEASGDDPERFFDGDRVVPVDLEAVEREEAERAEWLASPAAVEQRETSWASYADISAADSEELLQAVFSEQLATLNDDPARFLSDAQLIRPLEETVAAVKEDEEYALLDAGIPVRAEEENGDLAKVDLSLEAMPEGFEPANGLVDLTLPLAADEATEVGDEGFAISQAQADPSSARPFGDKNLFYSDVLPDTDLLVSPTATGVELFNLLRSKASPEDFRFAIEVPEGAVLQADGRGGAEVFRDGETLTRIAPPVATDAQGTDVPVEMTVESDEIVLHVAHREGDFAAPILLDPIVEDWANVGTNWYFGKKWEALSNGAWVYKSNNSQLKSWTCCWEGSHAGLMISSEKNVFYGAKQFGQWSYSTANSKTYIKKAWVVPYYREDESCTSVEPHNYVGMLWEPGETWNPLVTAKASGEAWVNEGNGHAFIIGMGTGNGVWIGCNRYAYAGGVALWIDDDWPPVVPSRTVTPSSGWLNDKSSINVGVNANDEGLGIYRATITADGKGPIPQLTGCTGLYGNRCPNSATVNFNRTGESFGEGIRTNKVSAEDPSGKSAFGPSFQTKVDRSPPEVNLSGQLAQATNEGGADEHLPGEGDELVLPVYNLNIEATDGSNQSDLTKRSGVKDIEVFLDGAKQTVPWSAQTATEDSRPMSKTYELKLSTLTTAGTHTLEVKVKDQVDNVRERKIEFEYFPATGIKDEYAMHYFPLPDGSDESEEEHPSRPELAVNVMNGNLVYREQDIEVDGAGADLEVERYYNSMLPTAENTEWGDGWTLAQTPELDSIDSGHADVLDASGALEDKVGVPTVAGTTRFDPVLQATIEKKATGGYELTDETGESATSVSFDSTGQAEALLADGFAKVDYSYEGGDLAEIEVSDPATFTAEPEIPESELITAPRFASSFGINGTGDGQLKTPADVAVDAVGNLWVVDKSNNRIQKFDSGGKYLAKFGSLGSGNGQLNRPTAIAIASNGDLLVTDSGNARVQRFTSAGAFLSKFGSTGTGTGQFSGSGPEGIAIDASGNVWVSDTYGGRLQKFSSAGAFLKAAGSKGSGSGQLGEPTGLDIDPSGNVWVADWQNNRVSRFNSNGEFLSQFGSPGSGDGQFSHPDEIEIDKLGNVWIGDHGNNRIQQFDLSAQFKGKFGSYGSGPGQFSFGRPLGIATDSKGHLWTTDGNNNRIQEWLAPLEKPAYISSFGVNGSADGQLKSPGDVALGMGGAVWVADKGNNRIQKFDSSGKYLAKFGSLGSANGQFNRPTSIAIDRDGNILVVDSNNGRVQKFDQSGQFISKFGSVGVGPGQFAAPEGVATDFQGNIWVADTDNGRLQKFDETGKLLKIVSSKGSGSGQLGEPVALDVDPASGDVWVADWQNNRIAVFDKEGGFVGQFGSAGTGTGQFNHPDGIEVDPRGNVWVGDQGNNRVQRFNLSGQFVGQFGSAGSGEGQFSFTLPLGIAADGLGRLWVVDVNNHRVQRWQLGNYTQPNAPELDLSDGDPKVDVETPAGLVSKVAGNAAGTHSYTHFGDDLTAHTGPSGKSEYTYDTSGRMTKVTLPNGTWGSIAYRSDGRVKTVTIDPAGSAPSKSTTFEYTDSPTRRTVVVPPDAPHVTYDIGEDGSVLKWWNALQPPVFDDLAGGLYENRNKEDGLSPGDQYLDITAHSEEGVASILVITNGDQLGHETTCEQTEAPGIECKTVGSEWVTNTELHAPGHLNVEVLVTDRLEHSVSERFWVDIPEPPPPPAPGTPVTPKFADVLSFREKFGLEFVFPVADEIERNERIFNLINAWYEGEPVARASWERWGVPLRPADVAELEYREWLYHENAVRIDQWVEATSPSGYAGYYIDHAAGGIMRVGFLGNQAEQLANLKSGLALVAPERVQVYPTTPTVSYLSVQASSQSVSNAIESNFTLRDLVLSVSDGEAGKAVRVGTENVTQVKSTLDQMFGPSAPIVVEYMSGGSLLSGSGRFRTSGRMRAGDNIIGHYKIGDPESTCTAGFGAYDRFKVGQKQITRNFVLTAGHCFRELYIGVFRTPHSSFGHQEDWTPLGQVQRNAILAVNEPVHTDAEAIWIHEAEVVPRGIFGWQGNLIPTEPAARARVGDLVCYSGAKTQKPYCGPIIAREKHYEVEKYFYTGGYWVEFETPATHGDSGAPVWAPNGGASIGLVTAGRPDGTFTQTLVEPLLHPPNMNANHLPGILHHQAMEPLQLKLGE